MTKKCILIECIPQNQAKKVELCIAELCLIKVSFHF